MDRDEEIAQLRRRLAELENPPRKASAATIRRPTSDARRVLIGLGVVGVLLLIGVLASNSVNEHLVSTYQPTETQRRIAAEIDDQAKSGPWKYVEETDPMTDARTAIACTRSSSVIRLQPPYRNTTASLCVRQSPRYGLDVFVRLDDRGQILCRPWRNCSVKVRFDDQAPRAFTAGESDDGSSDVIFIVNGARMLSGLRGADVTRIEMTFYQAGSQTVEFPTDRLEWPRPGGGQGQ